MICYKSSGRNCPVTGSMVKPAGVRIRLFTLRIQPAEKKVPKATAPQAFM